MTHKREERPIFIKKNKPIRNMTIGVFVFAALCWLFAMLSEAHAQEVNEYRVTGTYQMEVTTDPDYPEIKSVKWFFCIVTENIDGTLTYGPDHEVREHEAIPGETLILTLRDPGTGLYRWTCQVISVDGHKSDITQGRSHTLVRVIARPPAIRPTPVIVAEGG